MSTQDAKERAVGTVPFWYFVLLILPAPLPYPATFVL